DRQPRGGPGADGIAGDAVATEVARHRAREADDPFLGRRVVRLAHVAEAGGGAGVDDAARALLAKYEPGGLDRGEVTLHVDVDDEVPLLLGHVEHHAVAQDASVI